MKIVNRIDLLKLPENTVFMSYSPCIFGDLMIKGESLDDDWLETSVGTQFDVQNDTQYFDLLLESEKTGKSIEIDFESSSRNGLYDPPEALYAVWDENDVKNLINRLQECLIKG